MPNKALKAGSTLPPLAVKTALMTLISMEGNASLSVFSACSRGLSGLEAGASSLGGGRGVGSIFAVDGLDVVPVS